jgi:hypothetical protein
LVIVAALQPASNGNPNLTLRRQQRTTAARRTANAARMITLRCQRTKRLCKKGIPTQLFEIHDPHPTCYAVVATQGMALAQHEFNKRFWKAKTEKGGGEPH